MKRVKAGCIYQTLVFSQKEDCGLDKATQLNLNRKELEKYRSDLDLHNVRYQIVQMAERADSSIVVKVRKQINDSTPTDEYFK